MTYLVRCDTLDGGCDTVYPGDLIKCPKCGGATSLMAIPEPVDPLYYIYDIETYPNIFTCAFLHPATGTKWMFEISTRINMIEGFIKFMYQLQQCGATMVGYNNIHFDYPVIHYMMQVGHTCNVDMIYTRAMDIIKGRITKPIWDNERLVKQLDLFKINHYDNKVKSTSLKALEFAMRMDSIQDLPVELGKVLTSEEMDELIHYNWHDDEATVLFCMRCLEQISFREELSIKYGKDFSNMSDVKIGSEIFMMKLHDAGIQTHTRINGKREPIQTIRKTVPLIDCIPDYIQFETPEFKDILTRFKATTLKGDNVKALFKDFSTTIDGLEYVFGSGGLHSCTPGIHEADLEYMLLDIDGEAYYPSMIIANGFYPEHLTNGFSPIFKELVDERKRVGKKTTLGGALKLSANGTFGRLADKYSPFYDQKCLLSVTLTGQLNLCMFIEQVLKIPNCSMIQSNTDGITIKLPRIYEFQVKLIADWWKNLTGIIMEYAYYKRLIMSDVNNYIAEYED